MKAIGKKVKIIGIVVAVILIVGGVTAAIMLMRRRSLPDPETVKKIQRELKVGSFTLNENHRKTLAKNINGIDKFANDAFPGWNTTEEKLKELTMFAIALLELNVTNEDLSNCLSVVKSIINSIISELESKIGPLISAPWAENWYPFSVYVNRLFAMYEYLGDDSELKKKCHNQLIKITPFLGRSFRSTHEGENLFYVAVPRLCSNYLFDPEQFINDQADLQFTKLKRYLEFPIIKTNDVKEGRYADGSWICSGNVASYAELRKYDEYYERMYRLLGFPTGLKDAAESIFPKLLHPKIPFLPLGLVGRSGKVYSYKKYSNITSSETGVFVMPFMGFGVFKTPDFLFYVRVQRPGIAAFQSKKFKPSSTAVNTNDLGLGWVQLRKLYRNDYASRSDKIVDFTWDKLKEQPGLLTFTDGSEDLLNVFAVTGTDQTKSFQTNQTTLSSYIGQLNAGSMDISKKVLFWLNIYDFDDVYKNGCKVTEAAIVTDQGLQAYYIINNKTGKRMRFCCKDEQTEWIVKIDKVVANKYHDVAADTTTEFSWQVLRSTIDYDVKYNNGSMTFTFDGMKYTVNVGTEKDTYTVKDFTGKTVMEGSMKNTSL